MFPVAFHSWTLNCVQYAMSRGNCGNIFRDSSYLPCSEVTSMAREGFSPWENYAATPLQSPIFWYMSCSHCYHFSITVAFILSSVLVTWFNTKPRIPVRISDIFMHLTKWKFAVFSSTYLRDFYFSILVCSELCTVKRNSANFIVTAQNLLCKIQSFHWHVAKKRPEPESYGQALQ